MARRLNQAGCWIVNIDFDKKVGKNNSVLIRVWPTKPAGGGVILNTARTGGANAAKGTARVASKARTSKA